MKTGRKLKVGIVSIYDPHNDKKAHSGILSKINEAIENTGCETVWIRNPKSKLYSFLGKIAKVANMFLKKNICLDRTYIGSYLLANTIDKNAINQVDYIMIIHYYHVAYWLKTNKPIIYHSDATFDIINDYYIHNLWNWNKKQAEKIEIGALNNVDFHISSSNWRNESLINHYHIDKSKCSVLEYGPCVDLVSIGGKKSNDDIFHLLFFGVEWVRKGGEIAVETCKLLNEIGIKTVLTIVGIKSIPESCVGKEYIDFVGYLNKNSAEEYFRLQSIMTNTHIMILPTRAECSGIVFCESAAYGIPIITYDTGGVGNYVVNNLNGYRLPINCGPTQFAEKIKSMIEEKQLEKLSSGGLKLSTEKLNWTNWTKVLSEYFKESKNDIKNLHYGKM